MHRRIFSFFQITSTPGSRSNPKSGAFQIFSMLNRNFPIPSRAKEFRHLQMLVAFDTTHHTPSCTIGLQTRTITHKFTGLVATTARTTRRLTSHFNVTDNVHHVTRGYNTRRRHKNRCDNIIRLTTLCPVSLRGQTTVSSHHTSTPGLRLHTGL